MKKSTQNTLLILTGVLAVGAAGLVAWNMFGRQDSRQVEPKPSTGGSNYPDPNPNKGGSYNPITGEGSYSNGDDDSWYDPNWEDKIKNWWNQFVTPDKDPGDPPEPKTGGGYNPITGEGSYS